MPPGLVIAGTHSGSGKTLVTLGLLRAVARKGIRVQPFKVGPDYLDPGHLARVAARPARNLDSWLLAEPALRTLYAAALREADLGLVEGVMGLYDGKTGRDRTASTAEVAGLLGIPVLLVLDVFGMARSAAALARGYFDFDRATPLKGVLLNRVGSERHARLVSAALEEVGIRTYGWLANDPALRMPERHLGLVSAQETSTEAVADRAADQMERRFDLDGILELAREGGAHRIEVPEVPPRPPVRARIAFASDRAFQFYYPDSLDLLRWAGAELVPFSPIGDAELPEGTRGVYLGGGYPELHAAELAANRPMQEALRSASTSGLPVYAECGGLMYLMESLVDARGNSHRMCGLFPGSTSMARGGGALGYCEVRAVRETLLLPEGAEVRAHEYHVSHLESGHAELGYEVRNDLTGQSKRDGLLRGMGTLASYVHLHFASAGFLAERFVSAAERA